MQEKWREVSDTPRQSRANEGGAGCGVRSSGNGQMK